MNIDFPLILMLATFFTGVVALIDKIWLSKKREQGEPEGFVVEQSKSFFPVLLVVFVLRSFVAEPFQIPSGSMEPGLVKGDFIVVSKFSYGLRMPVWGNTLIPTGEPKRGDIMVFFPPEDPRYFIKRVIGLPGDTVVLRNKQLTVNGEPVDISIDEQQEMAAGKILVHEAFEDTTAAIHWQAGPSTQTGRTMVYAGPEGQWQVPEGFYFTMGDNRANSADSRMWGFVPEKNIVGKATAIWLHWDKLTDIPSFSRNGWLK